MDHNPDRFLLLGVLGWGLMFMEWYLLSHTLLMTLGGGMAVLFIFGLLTNRQSGRTTVALSATLMFFGLALSSWVYDAWSQYKDILQSLMALRLSLVLTAAGMGYLVFVYG